MKRDPYPQVEDTSGKTYWRSLGELDKSPEFAEAMAREFPEGASELPRGIARRSFLGVMGASVALASLSGCRRPDEKIVPYSRPPEEVIPGMPMHYATAMAWNGTAIGLLVESHEGRPTKIEGNPKHPESLGSTGQFAQATVLDLYDPDRSRRPKSGGAVQNWPDAEQYLHGLAGKLKASGGAGLAILTEAHRSPTLAAGLARLQQAMPQAKLFRYDAFSRDGARAGAKIAFGRPLEATFDLAQTSVIVSLDADLLANEGSAVKQARGFGEARDMEKRGATNLTRFYAIESAHTLSGAASDHRLRMKSGDIAGFAVALAAELASAQKVDLGGIGAGAAGPADEKAKKFVKAIAKDLAANKGKGVVVAGRRQPAAVHAIAAAINVALGNAGTTVRYLPAFDDAMEGADAIAALTTAIKAKSVTTLVILGGNPAFNAPGDLGFTDALKSVDTSVHLSVDFNETSAAAKWHVNAAHDLEAWGDVMAEDGTVSIVQPLIAPLYDGKTAIELVELLSGGTKNGYALVRATHTAAAGGLDPEKSWRHSLFDGFLPRPAVTAGETNVNNAAVAAAAKAAPAAAAMEITFAPDPHAWDGRFANNGWLQEAPDGMHKLTWGNVAAVSPATAKKLGVEDGDVLSIKSGGAEIKIPALIAPGQADDSIALTVGQGRSVVGTVGKDPDGKLVGVDVNPIRRTTGFEFAAAEASKTGERVALARTQEHFVLEGRPIAREVSAAELAKDPGAVKEMVKHLPLLDLWQPYHYDGHKWGMSIDLNQCIGCNACVVACQSENNIPVVGAYGVKLSREMHWVRTDRYFEGETDDPKSIVQPTLCNHCETAPCEEVCPVGATTHSPEGLNEMAYNRCIGTKYCGNNCPFKVRRFNFFNYTKAIPEEHKAQFNPEVTIRSRGVMEKCTFCVQRINNAKIAAHKEGRERVRDHEIVTACEQACPTHAIHFGDLNDHGSDVARKADSPRAYHALEELNIRPRVSYLARIRNTNPELESA